VGFPSGLFSYAYGQGNAGRLFVSTPLLTMDGGVIAAGAAANSHGNGGSIELSLGRLTLAGGAQIHSARFGAGRGGQVTVTATETIAIAGLDREGFPSRLSSNVFGQGNGGDVFVATPTLRMDGGLIQANLVQGSRGNGGNLVVQVGRLTLTGGAEIGSGEAGIISLDAPGYRGYLSASGPAASAAWGAVGI
jgi:hypothetical protein